MTQEQSAENDQSSTTGWKGQRPLPDPGPSGHVYQGYSGVVRVLRIALPLAALLILAVVLIWLNIGGMDDADPPTPTPPGQTEMTGARYQGVDESSRPYVLTSDRTVQSMENPDIVELVNPKADMTLEDGSWILMRAENGVFDQSTGVLTLKGNVELFHDQGYQLQTEQLSFNLEEGTASSDVRVWGHGPAGELDSSGLRITDRGQNITFLGHAHMTILQTASPNRQEEGVRPDAATQKTQTPEQTQNKTMQNAQWPERSEDDAQ